MISVEADHLTKRFGKTSAITSLSFQVKAGELFGFIGPDGAGKSTLFRILTTLMIPDEGRATVSGLDVVRDFRELRKRLGYMPGRFSLYQDLSVEENLQFFASVFGTSIQENYDLIRDIYVQIEPFKKRRAGQLSGGMKQKLALSCALIHKPEVLFLDEPTTGVDAVSRQEFWHMLKRLQTKGITIIVSTPYMDEAGLCDRIALIQSGKILDIDTPADVVGKFRMPLYAIKSRKTYPLMEHLRGFAETQSIFPFGEFLHYTDRRPGVSEQQLRDELRTAGFDDVEVMRTEPTIEDSFMALMEQHETQ